MVSIYAPTQGVRRGVAVVEFDQEGVLADIGGHPLELERLEAGPAEKRGVAGHELPEALDEALVHRAGARLLFRRRDLRDGVLADGLVGWPVRFLAVLRLYRPVSTARDYRVRRGYSRSIG